MSVKVNRIELDKTKGLTIQVVNGFNKQTIFLDGDKITITVQGLLGSSTIEQTSTSVTVNADEFTVNAGTITLNAELEASMSAGAIPAPVLPSKIGDKIGDKLKDKFGAKVADTIAGMMPTKPDLLPGPSRITLIPVTASVISPAIELLAEGNVNVIAPTVTVTGVEATTVTAPAGELLLDGNNTTITGTASMEIAAPNIVMAGALEYIPLE